MELPSEFAIPTAPAGIGDSIFEETPVPAHLETAEFRRTLGMFATGVTVITTRVGEQIHGMTANAFISVDRRAKMNALLREDARFGVSVLEETQTALSDRFAGREGGGQEQAFEIVSETPLVGGALAHLIAQVVRSYWGGDHSLFLGRVEYARYGAGTPLLFHSGGYGRVVGNPRFFSALPEDLLEPILAAGVERRYEDGEALMRAGEPGDSMMLVVEGTALVERGGRTVPVTHGELVGEIAVLDGGPRTATVVAEGPVRCIEISRDQLTRALEADPRAATALIGVLASRFRESS
jgi:flavin reductase (DIM6/NTAB) family NADH-FMN oxidoreductase RutF